MFSLQLATDGRPDTSQAYLTDPTGKPLRMDVYKPSGTPSAGKSAPVMMYVHGGGWNSGEPDETAARLGVFGGSAGGNLVLTTTYAAAAGKLTPACKGTVPKVSAVAAGVPAVDPAYVYDTPEPMMKGYTQKLVRDFLGGTPAEHPDRLAAVQVRSYLTPKAPPTFFSASIGDHIVPVDGTRRFEREARAAGVDITSHYIPFSTTPPLCSITGSPARRYAFRSATFCAHMGSRADAILVSRTRRTAVAWLAFSA